MTVLVVTGTGTGVGKTIATAALAAAAVRAGIEVTVCKPVQTGIADGDDDLAEVTRLTGLRTVVGLARYPEPLAPLAAAERAGQTLPGRAELLDFVGAHERPEQLTLVEGAGGLLVELGCDGVTLRDLAADLRAPVLVVVSAHLGTLNHTALTVEALAAKELSLAGLVIGSWPRSPGVVERSNRDALTRLGPVRAVLPADSAQLDVADFATMSAQSFDRGWLTGLTV